MAKLNLSEPPLVEASSSSLPEVVVEAPAVGGDGKQKEYVSPAYQPRQPFESVAMAVKASSNGFGIDLATPLNDHYSLRVGASFTKLSVNLMNSGLNVNAALALQGAIAAVDIFPFRRSSFHISPGINFSNETQVIARFYAPIGTMFSFGNGEYTTDPSDPLYGEARFRLGHRVAPRLTVGWGNMIPHGRGHWSVPFEIGMQYIARPTVSLTASGSVCDVSDASNGCGPIEGDPDLAEEQRELQNDVNGLRVFPVVSIGVSYRFGKGAGVH